MVFGNDDSFVDRHSEMKIIEIVEVLVQCPSILFNLVQSHAYSNLYMCLHVIELDWIKLKEIEQVLALFQLFSFHYGGQQMNGCVRLTAL